ncbi:MAG TPA: thioredoxin family protein [Puia sp.]|jgi:thiol-disulfide isomerase/thioredoxin|nr:thioredoxin family protein [Puia sp.]
MKYSLLIFSFLIAPFCYSQYSENADEVFSHAKQLNKPVLLIFSGSDWCQPCIRFEKKILTDTAFITFSNKSIFVLTADFPQRKKQSSSLIGQNEQLAKLYNPHGLFPFMVLLNPEKKIIHTITYTNEDAVSFINLIRGYF